MPVFGQRVGDGGKDGWRSHRLPDHHKSQPNKKVRPCRTEKINEVTNGGGRKKCQKGFTPPPVIGQPSPWILVQRVEKIFSRTKQAHGRYARAQRFQVFGKKLLPKLFAQSTKKIEPDAATTLRSTPK